MGRGELERFLNSSAGEEDHYGGGAVVPICLYVLGRTRMTSSSPRPVT